MRALCLILSLVAASPSLAQDSSAVPAALPGAAPSRAGGADTAVLSVGNRAVFVFRAPAGAFSPKDRSEMALERIRRAQRPGADSVRVYRDSLGAMILLNETPAFMILPADVPRTVTGSVDEYAAEVASLLLEGLAVAEEATSARALAIGAASVALATVLLVVLLRLLTRGRSWLAARASGRLPGLRVGGVAFLPVAGLRRAVLVVLGALAWATGLLLVYSWVTFTLTRFAYTRPWGLVFGRFLATTAGAIGLAMLHSIPDLLTVALIVLAARGIQALLRGLFDAVAEGRIEIPGMHPDTVSATRRIVNAVIWMFALASAYPLLPGASSASFQGISVLAGVLVTFGSAGLVGQAMSGLLLMYARGYKTGDFIRVGVIEGTVVELGLLSTRIRTVANEFILVPNNTMVGGSITDYSAAGREGRALFVTASVTIGYDAPWQRIHGLLLAAGEKLEGALRTPDPFVLQRALNDFYVHYEVFVPIHSDTATALPRLRSELNALIQDTFWAAGQEITSPHFYALRDGNTVTIPPEFRPKEPAPSFRVAVDPT